jgi:hypothetical protein
MAQIINRNGEITQDDFNVLKDRFSKKTNTQALYSSVDFIVKDLPKIEQRLKVLMIQNEMLRKNYGELLEIISKINIKDLDLDLQIHSLQLPLSIDYQVSCLEREGDC